MLYGNNQDANSVRANVQLVTRVSDASALHFSWHYTLFRFVFFYRFGNNNHFKSFRFWSALHFSWDCSLFLFVLIASRFYNHFTFKFTPLKVQSSLVGTNNFSLTMSFPLTVPSMSFTRVSLNLLLMYVLKVIIIISKPI